jgi:hypothetical protein
MMLISGSYIPSVFVDTVLLRPPSPSNFTDCLNAIFMQLIFEEKTMAVNAFNIMDFLEKSGILTMTSIDGKPFKIRVRFESNVGYSARKHAIRILQEIGFQQVGNTSSWILMPKSDFNVEAD